MFDVRFWLGRPDRFDVVTQSLSQRNLLWTAQIVLASVAMSSSVVPVILLVSRPLTTTGMAITAMIGLFVLVVSALFLTRWPTRHQSQAAALLGAVCIFLFSMTQSNLTTAAVATAVFAVTGTYFVLFHTLRLLLLNMALAVIASVFALERLIVAGEAVTAAVVFWIVLLLNIATPIFALGISAVTDTYAVHASADSLTGLLNRRGFFDVFERYLLTQQRHDEQLYVVVIDLDDFKCVNDTYGHAIGDEVLVAVTGLLRANTPPKSVICRSGGEEFLVALTAATLDATEITTSLLEAIAALPVGVTASIGVAIASAPLDSWTGGVDELARSLIAAADEAMYEAKRRGGNQMRYALMN